MGLSELIGVCQKPTIMKQIHTQVETIFNFKHTGLGVLEIIPEEDIVSYMPTEVHNHINRLTMEVAEGKVQNPLEDATVYINCAVYENGLLESPAMKETAPETIDLCADKKIHFVEKSIERSAAMTTSAKATDEENNQYEYMNGDCSAEELKKLQQANPNGGYVAKTRVFQTQEIRITKTRRPLAPKAVLDNEKNLQISTVAPAVIITKEIRMKESQLPQTTSPVDTVSPADTVDSSKEAAEILSSKHKQEVVSTAEEPPRKKRYLCRDIVIPAYGQLYKNEGLTTPSAKVHLDARCWALGKDNSSEQEFDFIPTPEECLLFMGEPYNANKIAEIVYTSFRPRVHKEKHVRLLFPPPYHPKDPEPEVQVQVVPSVEEKPEEIVQENSVPVKSTEEEENEEDPKLSKRGRKKRNWFQRMWRNLRHRFQADEQRRDA